MSAKVQIEVVRSGDPVTENPNLDSASPGPVSAAAGLDVGAPMPFGGPVFRETTVDPTEPATQPGDSISDPDERRRDAVAQKLTEQLRDSSTRQEERLDEMVGLFREGKIDRETLEAGLQQENQASLTGLVQPILDRLGLGGISRRFTGMMNLVNTVSESATQMMRVQNARNAADEDQAEASRNLAETIVDIAGMFGADGLARSLLGFEESLDNAAAAVDDSQRRREDRTGELPVAESADHGSPVIPIDDADSPIIEIPPVRPGAPSFELPDVADILADDPSQPILDSLSDKFTDELGQQIKERVGDQVQSQLNDRIRQSIESRFGSSINDMLGFSRSGTSATAVRATETSRLTAAMGSGASTAAGAGAGGAAVSGSSAAAGGAGASAAAGAGGAAAGGLAAVATVALPVAAALAVVAGSAYATNDAFGPLGVTLTAVNPLMGLFVAGLQKAVNFLTEDLEEFAQFSSEAAIALAESEAARIEDDIDTSIRAGKEFAQFESLRNRADMLAQNTWVEIKILLARLVEPLLPFLEAALTFLEAILDVAKTINDLLGIVVDVITLQWDRIPGRLESMGLRMETYGDAIMEWIGFDMKVRRKDDGAADRNTQQILQMFGAQDILAPDRPNAGRRALGGMRV